MAERPHDPFDLQRFVTAQDGGVYEQALDEVRAGAKRSHWMWFVFPQLAGLGRSDMARRYAVSGLDEAHAYLAHPLLGARLQECSQALLELPDDRADAVAVFGQVDAAKLRSSMTLFARATGKSADGSVFAEVLDRYFAGSEDDATVSRL